MTSISQMLAPQGFTNPISPREAHISRPDTRNRSLVLLLALLTTLVLTLSNITPAHAEDDSLYADSVTIKGITYSILNSSTSAAEVEEFDGSSTTVSILPSVTNVTIPNSVTTIGDGAFYNNQLTNVTIPNSVTTIGRWAFYNNQLTNVTIPNSVTTIGNGAFSYNQLTSIIISDSVTTIGEEAFYYNGDLILVTFRGAASIASKLVDKISDDVCIAYLPEYGADVVGEGGFTTPEWEGYRAYPDAASCGYENPKEDEPTPPAPPSVDEVQNQTIDDIVYSLDTDSHTAKVIDYVGASNSVTIPNFISANNDDFDVTSIGQNALSNKNLHSVFIPDSVLTIGDNALANNQLLDLTIPSNVTTIGTGAFSHNQIKTLQLGKSVETIGASAFEDNLIRVLETPESLTTIDEKAFNENRLSTIKLTESLTTLGDEAFANNDLRTVHFPCSVEQVDASVYANNPRLTPPEDCSDNPKPIEINPYSKTWALEPNNNSQSGEIAGYIVGIIATIASLVGIGMLFKTFNLQRFIKI